MNDIFWESDSKDQTAAGLNDNVEFMGKQLHVQTESIGSPAPCIVTQIFSNGRVIFSKKSECSADLNKIQDQMNQQHSQVIRNIAEKEARILKAS
jgi:hypothetical protein